MRVHTESSKYVPSRHDINQLEECPMVAIRNTHSFKTSQGNLAPGSDSESVAPVSLIKVDRI